MKKQIIKDIRIYRSQSQNEYGTYLTDSFDDKELNAIAKRIVMKLRENKFSLGEFDHLYINFTTCDMTEKMRLSTDVDRYHPWYRYCYVYIEKDFYDKLGAPETRNSIVELIITVLVTYFTTEDFDKSLIMHCVNEAVQQGENMLMKFKEKVNKNRRAVIFLRYLDTGYFSPLLRVYDKKETLLFEKDLPLTLTLDSLGDIKIDEEQITIKPRKNAFTTELKALVYKY